jgi:magnesium-transporting ATPase (P-type)
METAINIGFACRLLEKGMQRFEINFEHEPQVRDALQETVNHLQQRLPENDNYALVLTGESLEHIQLPFISKMVSNYKFLP